VLVWVLLCSAYIYRDLGDHLCFWVEWRRRRRSGEVEVEEEKHESV